MHKTVGIIFDRSNDGDFKAIQPHQIAELHNNKRNYYTENIIYSGLQFEDLKQSLFSKVRNLIRSNNPEHPWLALNDKDLLRIAGLWRHDNQTNKEGYTLAAVLLFGKDEVIQQIVPHYKIDAIVRVDDVDRYDDREYIQTNLIEAYDILMDFIAKHLPDKFYLVGTQRVSLRTKIFREIIANLVVHREYTNAYPCRFIIYTDRVEAENANNPRGLGKIDPANFSPYPKNPTIAKFFIQLGRVEELGSGVLNVSNLAKEYSNGGEASFIEGSVFKMIMPINYKANSLNGGANGGANTIIEVVGDIIKDSNRFVLTSLSNIIDFVNNSADGANLQEVIVRTNKSKRTAERYLKMLREAGIIEFKGSSKIGKYYLTESFQQKIKIN